MENITSERRVRNSGKKTVEREPCTCSPTLRVCPACHEWANRIPEEPLVVHEIMYGNGHLRVQYANGEIGMTHFSRALIEQVRDLRQTGLSLRKIAAILHKSFHTVGKVSRISIIEEAV